MLAKVRKVMQANDGILQPDDIVDVSGWRNVRSLVSGRYIELIADAPAESPKPKVEKKAEDKIEEKAKAKK